MRSLVRTSLGALLWVAAAACGSTETRRASGAAIPAGPLPIGAEARAVDGTALYPPPLSSEVTTDLLEYLRANGPWTGSVTQVQNKVAGVVHLLAGTPEYQFV